MNGILLPIKSIYLKEIISGRKKYEYRKRLCIADIQTIYFYETAPVKLVTATAKVLGKIRKDKENLWCLTCKNAGIEKKYYLQYFAGQTEASAYVLGKITVLPKPFTLEELGILNPPQSFMYLKT